MRCSICKFECSSWYRYYGQTDDYWYCRECLDKQLEKLGMKKEDNKK